MNKVMYLDTANLLNSVIESVYLGVETCEDLKDSSILVAPQYRKDEDGTKGLFASLKGIIIQNLNCCNLVLNWLIDEKNTNNVVSRVSGYSDKYPMIRFCPYILKPNFNIVWNGISLSEEEFLYAAEEYKSIDDKLFINYCEYNNILSLPKIINPSKELVMDGEGNLTSIGWAMQQIGVNIKTDTVFKDLDILKTKKTLFR